MMARILEQILEIETPGVVAEATVKAQAMLLDIRLGASGSGDKTQADTAGALEGNSLVLSRSKGRIEG